jgi:hypothetical protein
MQRWRDSPESITRRLLGHFVSDYFFGSELSRLAYSVRAEPIPLTSSPNRSKNQSVAG